MLLLIIVLLMLGTAGLSVKADEREKSSLSPFSGEIEGLSQWEPLAGTDLMMIASGNAKGNAYEDKMHLLTEESPVKRDLFSIKAGGKLLKDIVPEQIPLKIRESLQAEIDMAAASLRKELSPINASLLTARQSYNTGSYLSVIGSYGLFYTRNRAVIEKLGLEVLPSQQSILEEAQEIAVDKKDSVALRKIADEWIKLGKSDRGLELRGAALSMQSEKAQAEKKEPVTLVVYNRTATYSVNIFVNRNLKGTLKPQQKGEFANIAAWDTLTLEAMDVNASYGWGPRKVSVNPGETLYWKLYEE
jgi:hypothetical protein